MTKTLLDPKRPLSAAVHAAVLAVADAAVARMNAIDEYMAFCKSIADKVPADMDALAKCMQSHLELLNRAERAVIVAAEALRGELNRPQVEYLRIEEPRPEQERAAPDMDVKRYFVSTRDKPHFLYVIQYLDHALMVTHTGDGGTQQQRRDGWGMEHAVANEQAGLWREASYDEIVEIIRTAK